MAVRERSAEHPPVAPSLTVTRPGWSEWPCLSRALLASNWNTFPINLKALQDAGPATGRATGKAGAQVASQRQHWRKHPATVSPQPALYLVPWKLATGRKQRAALGASFCDCSPWPGMVASVRPFVAPRFSRGPHSTGTPKAPAQPCLGLSCLREAALSVLLCFPLCSPSQGRDFSPGFLLEHLGPRSCDPRPASRGDC